MGVDVGQNFLAVASTTDRKCRFFCGGKARDLRNIYSTMRKRLQSKGTRSAKRMLKHLSGRERRLMTDMNHRISKEIVEFAVQNKVDVIGLEDLSGVRDRTETSKKQRYTHHWAFFELQSFIEYKAREKGISTVYVDPAYTSQTCPRCNHISKNNRRRRSFVCECCGHSLHADLIGARNIESRARTYRYNLEVQGCSQPPRRELSMIESQAPPERRGVVDHESSIEIGSEVQAGAFQNVHPSGDCTSLVFIVCACDRPWLHSSFQHVTEVAWVLSVYL